MLTAIGDLVKSTFSESLKRPFQPSGLFAAAIFLVLNVALIYPLLIDVNEPAAETLRDAGGTAQAAAAAVSLLILSYVLGSMSGTVLKLMTGEAWQESVLIGPWLKARYQRLAQQNKAPPRSEVAASPDSQKGADSAPPAPAPIADRPWKSNWMAATELGNVLNATAQSVWERYGIATSSIWVHMETALARDSNLAIRLAEEKATLDFLLNLAFVLYFFAVEYAVVCFALRDWEAVWSLVFVLAGWGIYRVAIGKARSWSALVRLAFEAHRDELRKSLGLRRFRSLADEKTAWIAVSSWLAEPSPAGIGDLVAYGEDEPLSNGPQLCCSANAEARVVNYAWQQDSNPKIASYLIFVSRSKEAIGSNSDAGVGELQILMTDRNIDDLQLACIGLPPEECVASDGEADKDRLKTRSGWSCRVVATPGAAAPTSLLWSHQMPPVDGSMVLCYTYPKGPDLDAAATTNKSTTS